MVQNRNIVTCIILSIITCGIYTLYWNACLADDANRLKGDMNGTSGGMVVLLSIITCGIYRLYWSYKVGETLNQIQTQRGMPADSNKAILYLLLSLFGLSIVTFALVQDEFNKFATQA